VKGRPLRTQEGDLLTERSVAPDGYGRFLIDVFEEWVRRDVGEVFVQMFDVALANWHGEPPGLCVHSETCGLALAIEHTATCTRATIFVEPAFKLGNIKDKHMIELINSPQQQKFGFDKRDTLLPRMRRSVRVPRRLPQGPLHRRSVWGARSQLPLPELQGVLPPHRCADAGDVRAPHHGPSPLRARPRLRGAGRRARPERALHLRLGPEVEGLTGGPPAFPLTPSMEPRWSPTPRS
jgi:hypothetical protein